MTKEILNVETLRAAAIELHLNPDTCSLSDIVLGLINQVAELRDIISLKNSENELLIAKITFYENEDG